jgi:hypothetical protein
MAHQPTAYWLVQVLVLPLEARVNERQLAALLHTSRSRVKLAPAGALVQLCGYTGGQGRRCVCLCLRWPLLAASAGVVQHTNQTAFAAAATALLPLLQWAMCRPLGTAPACQS